MYFTDWIPACRIKHFDLELYRKCYLTQRSYRLPNTELKILHISITKYNGHSGRASSLDMCEKVQRQSVDIGTLQHGISGNNKEL